MAEYIERKAFAEDIRLRHCKGCYGQRNEIYCAACWVDDMLDEIELAPAADVVEVRHEAWVHSDMAAHWCGKDKCSGCHYRTYDGLDLSHFNYCPNCGAKMDGKGEGE